MPRALLVAVAVAVVGFLVVGQGFTNPGADCAAGPGASYWHEDVGPLGSVECEGHRASGAHYYWVIHPWEDWATVLLVAASAGLLVLGLGRRSMRVAAAAVLLFWVAVLAWFLESALVSWALVAVAAAAAVAISRAEPR